MPKKPPNQGKRWTPEDVTKLEELVQSNTPTRLIGLKMGRSPKAVYDKASEQGVSVKPTNQRPDKRRKK